MFFWALNNCCIVDGTGRPSWTGSVAISDGKIAAVHSQPLSAVEELDCSGLVLTPGFVDIHSHSDVSVQAEPGAASRVMQGITTEVIGNCGFSPAPAGENQDLLEKAHGTRAHWLSWDWNSVDQYLSAIEAARPAVNVAFLIGHAALRIAAMGYDRRSATSVELGVMTRLLAEGLEQGAAGMSSGLAYAPGLYATRDEMIRLASVCAEHGKLYATHVRNEGTLFAEGIQEAVDTAVAAKVQLQISHVKLLGKANWGRVDEILRLIDQGLAAGADIRFDCYPYEAGSTALTAFFPPWVHEGGFEVMKQIMSADEGRERIKRSFAAGEPGWWNPAVLLGWEQLIISSCPGRPDVVGTPVSDLGTGDLIGAVCDLVVECEGLIDVVAFGACAQDLAEIVASRLAMIGSDGLALAPGGTTGKGRPHPRSFGTFPRVYDRYVRDGRLSLEEAVQKMTYAPAVAMGLADRGAIRQGWAADLVLFDPDLFGDRATYEQPFLYPEGVFGVWVNGERVVDHGQATGRRPGIVLRM